MHRVRFYTTQGSCAALFQYAAVKLKLVWGSAQHPVRSSWYPGQPKLTQRMPLSVLALLAGTEPTRATTDSIPAVHSASSLFQDTKKQMIDTNPELLERKKVLAKAAFVR